MMRRGRRIWVGASAFLVVVGLLGPATALAATTSWEFETSAEYPGQILNLGQTLAGGGPTEPHEYLLANTGETPISVDHFRIGLQQEQEPHLWTDSHPGCQKGSTIEPGQTCSVGIVFNPLAAAWRRGFVEVIAVNGEPPPARVDFEAHAIGPRIRPEPDYLDFGSVQVGAGPSPIQTVTLANDEPLPLMIYGVSVTDPYERPESPSPFRVVGGSCREGVVVPTSASCTIEIILEASQAGSFDSKVVIADNAESAQSLVLRGVGEAPRPPLVGPTTNAKSERDHAVTSVPVAPATSIPAKPKLLCPKGKRRAARQGKTVCVRRHKHHRHRGHTQRP